MAEELEHNETGKRLNSGPEASRAPSDWRSCMERTMRQQAQEQTQMHPTVGQLAYLLEAPESCEEAQWPGMITWMQEREQMRDSWHERYKLLWAGIIIPTVMVKKGVTPGQEVSGKDTEKTAKMDSGVLQASWGADTPQDGRPEEHQSVQLPRRSN